MWFTVIHEDEETNEIGGFGNGNRLSVKVPENHARGLGCELGLSDSEQAQLAQGEAVEKDAGWGGTSWFKRG